MNDHYVYLPRSENETGCWFNLATISQIVEYDDGAVVVLFSHNERRIPLSSERALILMDEILEICSTCSKERYVLLRRTDHTRRIYNSDFIDYEIINGQCSYCGKDAEYGEDSFGKTYSYCASCDSYNIELEMEM